MKGRETALGTPDEEYKIELKDLQAVRDGFLNDAKNIENSRNCLPLSFKQKTILQQKLTEIQLLAQNTADLLEAVESEPKPCGSPVYVSNMHCTFDSINLHLGRLYKEIKHLSTEGLDEHQALLHKVIGVDKRVAYIKGLRTERDKLTETRKILTNIARQGTLKSVRDALKDLMK